MTGHEQGGEFQGPGAEQMRTMEANRFQLVGRLKLGEGKIETTIDTEPEAEEFFDEVMESRTEVEDRKCAVCIDGRCGVCTAADVQTNDEGQVGFDSIKPPIRPHVPGGLYFYVTVSAVIADLEVVRDAKSLDEAYSIIGGLLDKEGYHDGGHTTVVSYGSFDKTECGAKDGIASSTEKAVVKDDESTKDSSVNGIDEAIAALNGLQPEEVRSNQAYEAVRYGLRNRYDKGFFNGFNSVESLAKMLAKDKRCVELLESDTEHPTNLHTEMGVMIMDTPGETIDRDDFYKRTGKRVFIFDRWFLNTDIAPLVAKPEEAERLKLAGDYATAIVANALVKQGMWAAYCNNSN